MGFELLEAADTRIRPTNLIAENVDVRKSALRLRLVMLGVHRDAVQAVLTDDESLARRVIDRDDEADKLFAMVTRHFRRALTNLTEVEKLEFGRDELFEYYSVSRQFERVADHAVTVARFALDPEATVPEAFADEPDSLAAGSRKVVDAAADVILPDTGTDAAHQALTEREALSDDLGALDRELYAHDEPAEAYVVGLGLLLDSVRRTAEYGTNVAGIAVQQVVRESEPEFPA